MKQRGMTILEMALSVTLLAVIVGTTGASVRN